MAKGRRKVRASETGPEAAPGAAVAARPAPPPGRPPAHRPRRKRLLLIAAAAIVVVGAGVFAMLQGDSDPSYEPRGPDLLSAGTRDVQEHVKARVARAREAPGDVERLTDLALALAANGFWRESREAFEHLARLTPDDPLPAYYVAMSYASLQDVEGARAAIERVLARFPRFPQALYLLGTLQLEAGELEAAAARFKEQIAVEGESSTWGRLGLGKALLQMGKPDQAIAQLERAIEQDPRLPELNYALGSAYRAVKRLDDAARHLARGIHANANAMPDPWSARLDAEARTLTRRIQQAQRMNDAGRTTDAIALLEETRVSNPDDLELLSNLGGLYLGREQVEEAAAVLSHARNLNAAHLPTLYNLIVVEMRRGRTAEAVDLARKAVDLAPAHYHSHLSLSDAYAAASRWPDAVAAIRESIRIDPRNPQLRLKAAALLFRTRQIQDAKTEAEAATRLDPSNAEAWMMLCESYIKLKRAADARAALDQASRLAPRAPQIATLTRMIRELEGS